MMGVKHHKIPLALVISDLNPNPILETNQFSKLLFNSEFCDLHGSAKSITGVIWNSHIRKSLYKTNENALNKTYLCSALQGSQIIILLFHFI